MPPALRRLAAAPILLAAALLALAFSAGAQERTVRIVTEGARPPFNYVENGEPAGFEVELGRALCAQARLACTFGLHQWEGLVRGLLAREYDAVMASVAITERRRQRVAFTRPYYRMPGAFVGRKGLDFAPDAAGLKGRTVGIVERSPYGELIAQRFPGVELRPFDKAEDANLDLLTGRVDLVFHEKLALAEFLGRREGKHCCRFYGDVPPAGPSLGEGVGMALRPDDGALREAFDRAIAAVMADGTYDRIRAKYVAFDLR